MKPDITTQQQIQFLVDSFYKKVLIDDVIGHFFTQISPINKLHHMPIMYQFWESVLLDKATYKGRPIDKHIQLDQLSNLKVEHFNRWLALWHQTIDEYYAGQNAEKAKQRATQVGQLIQFKIEQSRNQKGFIQ